MKIMQAVKWLGTAIIVVGAATLAISPEFAHTSIVPFLMMLIGQTIYIFCSLQIRDWPTIAMSVGFMCIDLYGVFVRLT
jgi:hypothetical protein